MTIIDTVRETPIAELPRLAGLLAEAQAIILSRLSTPMVAPVEPEADRLLTADEAAEICGLTVEQLRRRRDLPFRRRVGKRTVRYSSTGIARWMKRGMA